MNKKFIKMNDNNIHLSLGNFCRVIKEVSLNKAFAGQSEIFCTIFNIDTVNDSTINNYCIGYRSIGSNYKELFYKYRDNYKKDKSFMEEIILNLISIIDGYVYTSEYKNKTFINSNNNLKEVCSKMYNIAKNDVSVNNNYTLKIQEYLNDNKLYECINEILFYIILEKKQPIYIDNLVKETIESILNNTNISINDLESFLKLQFKDGTNYIYSIKKLAKSNNPYACFELGLMEYDGEITGNPRYNKAFEYLNIAANYNHPRANYLIGKMLLENKIGNNTKENIESGLKYLKTAEQLGSIAATNTLGLYYLNFLNDEKTAIQYFNKAIEYDYVYAYNNLGKIYENKKKYDKAFNCYIESANLEESWACNKVGEYYRLGIGVDKDIKKAFYYYNLALNVPIKLLKNWCKFNLAKYFYLEGNYEVNIEKDEEKAISYFKEAANSNIIDASIELIYYYSNKYFKTMNKELLNKINEYIKMVETNPNYNDKYKKIIEKNLLKIKEKKEIDTSLFNI